MRKRHETGLRERVDLELVGPWEHAAWEHDAVDARQHVQVTQPEGLPAVNVAGSAEHGRDGIVRILLCESSDSTASSTVPWV